MHYRMLAALAVVAALGASWAVEDAVAQTRWSWNGSVPAGQAVEIKGVNGDVRAVAARGNEVRVSAEKSGRRSDPGEVEIVVLQHAGGVTICAVYPTPSGRPANECRPGAGGRNNVQNNDVKVTFNVEVPSGVNVITRTVNGGIDVSNVSGHVLASSVNGGVSLSTAGTAEAKTVNGSINAVLGRADWRDAISFETVNGSVTVTLGGDVNTDVRASTVNGNIDTDFPVTVQGRFGPRSVNGTIGQGGRLLEIKTVNGAIRLRRS